MVALLSSLNVDENTATEVLEVYYEGLEQGKQNGFSTNVLIVENRPNLYKLLKSRGLTANVIENEKDNDCTKQLKKANKIN